MNAVKLYLSVRQKEGRLFSDEEVRRLPFLPAGHPLAGEWRARAAACDRLVRYLGSRARPLAILEAGCGNGWLCGQIGRLPGARVVGCDRNLLELGQAGRLFAGERVSFLAAGLCGLPFGMMSFDGIVLASVVQYLPDLPALIHSLRPLLWPGGEIHILDSPLYAPDEVVAARQRSRDYYAALGFPEMSDHYFHHSITDLDEFSPRWLYRPERLGARLRRRLGESISPFPWVCVS